MKKTKIWRGLALVVMLVMLTMGVLSCEHNNNSQVDKDDANVEKPDNNTTPEKPDSVPEAETTDTLTTLKALGFSTAGLDDARLDPNGNPLPKNFNPFSGKNFTLNKFSETFFGPIVETKADSNPDDNVDDAEYKLQNYLLSSKDLLDTNQDNYPAPVKYLAEKSWNKMPYKTMEADVDGDGFEEVVSLLCNTDTNKIEIRVFDNQDTSTAGEVKKTIDYSGNISTELDLKKTDDKTFPSSTLPGLPPTPPKVIKDFKTRWDNIIKCTNFRDLAIGDIDGDAIDEVIIRVGNNVYILDDAKHNYDIITEKAFEPYASLGVRLAVDYIDLDQNADIIICDGKDLYIYTNKELTENLAKDVHISFHREVYNICTGDFDGDGLREIFLETIESAGFFIDTSFNKDSKIVFEVKTAGIYIGEFSDSGADYKYDGCIPMVACDQGLRMKNNPPKRNYEEARRIL